MREVSDSFLLNMAEVSAALIGLFLVAVIFFVESGFDRAGGARRRLGPYFRSGTRIVLVLYSIPLGVSLTLVVLDLVWSRALFALLSVILVAANVDTARRVRGVTRQVGSKALLLNEIAGTVGVAVLVILPWALGRLHPTRGDLTWAILLSFATGFFSVCALVLSVFDVEGSNASDAA